MKNKKIDIDTLFSQLREEARPTPMQSLIEARPSGALFALKTSLSSSLVSVKMWIGLACLSALVTTGVLYTVHESVKQEHVPAIQHVNQKVQAEQVRAMAETEALGATETSAAVMTHSVLPAETSGMDVSTVHTRSTATRNIANANGVLVHENKRTLAENASKHSEEVRSSGTTADDITTARYRETASHAAMEYEASAPTFFALPEEKFPFPDATVSRPREMSLMLNGLPLLADIVQVQGEFQINERMSYGLLLGVGNVQGQTADTSHALFMAGAQFNYYLLGDFEEGLQIGAQALFSSTNIGAHKTMLYENGRVMSLTPYAGYKLVLTSGLTMNVQAGVGASTPVFIPTAPGSGNNTEYKWHVSTRMHLNIGWSL
jgi:hypothetical protein